MNGSESVKQKGFDTTFPGEIDSEVYVVTKAVSKMHLGAGIFDMHVDGSFPQ